MNRTRCQPTGWKTMGELIDHPAPDLSLVTPPESVWERERRALRALLPGLRLKYDGQYVAIKDGKVAASGPDEVAWLSWEAYSRVGYGPLYLGYVSDSHPSGPIPVGPSAARPGPAREMSRYRYNHRFVPIAWSRCAQSIPGHARWAKFGP